MPARLCFNVMEKESEGKISFLDVQIKKKEGKLSTEVYRKNTHTDKYIKYASHHHPRTKTGAIACLRNRAEVCDQQFLKSANMTSEEDL